MSDSSLSKFHIRRATREDIPAIVEIVNRAFQVEAFFLMHDRTSIEGTTEMFDKGEFLLAESANGETLGSVYFENRGKGHAYFGMLSVVPEMKGTGLGRFLIESVEDHARRQGCSVMEITVVNLRTELPPFYRRFGYEISGELPPPAQMRSRIPCHLIQMSKALA